jgi:hypothetical protein
MKTSDQLDQIAPSLASAQGQIRDAAKDQKGYGYTYANLASILQILRPVYAAHGLAVIQETATEGDAVEVLTRIIHSSGQWIETGPLRMAVEAKKGLSQAQCLGSVVTYARRYALAAAAGITQDDDDGASAAPMTQAVPASPRDGLVAAARSAASRVGRDTALAALRDAGWESTSAVPEGHIGKAIALLEGLSK